LGARISSKKRENKQERILRGICGDREVWRERMIDDVGISVVRIWIRLTTISKDRGYCFRKGVMVGVNGSV